MLERSTGEKGAALLAFAVAGEYGGGGSATAGLRVGSVVANGLLGSRFLAIAIGDLGCGVLNVDDLEVVLMLFCDFFELNLRSNLSMAVLSD